MFNFLSEIKQNLKVELDSFNLINISGRLLYVEGHAGLVTLSKEIISFKVKKGVVMVEGSDLVLSEMSENTIKITGNIKKVEQIWWNLKIYQHFKFEV